MIHEFARQIYLEDPTFITGFNDSSFDFPFIRQKLEYYSDPEFVASGLTKEDFKRKTKRNPKDVEMR